MQLKNSKNLNQQPCNPNSNLNRYKLRCESLSLAHRRTRILRRQQQKQQTFSMNATGNPTQRRPWFSAPRATSQQLTATTTTAIHATACICQLWQLRQLRSGRVGCGGSDCTNVVSQMRNAANREKCLRMTRKRRKYTQKWRNFYFFLFILFFFFFCFLFFWEMRRANATRCRCGSVARVGNTVIAPAVATGCGSCGLARTQQTMK